MSGVRNALADILGKSTLRALKHRSFVIVETTAQLRIAGAKQIAVAY